MAEPASVRSCIDGGFRTTDASAGALARGGFLAGRRPAVRVAPCGGRPVSAVSGVSGRVAFLGHDGGHQQILRGRRGNELVSLVAGNLLVGLSFGWWVDKHNRHHAHPNHEGLDPDIGDGVLALAKGIPLR